MKTRRDMSMRSAPLSRAPGTGKAPCAIFGRHVKGQRLVARLRCLPASSAICVHLKRRERGSEKFQEGLGQHVSGEKSVKELWTARFSGILALGVSGQGKRNRRSCFRSAFGSSALP